MATIKYETVRPAYIGRTLIAQGRELPDLFKEGVCQIGDGFDHLWWVESVEEQAEEGVMLRLVDRKGTPFYKVFGLDARVEVFQTISTGDPFEGLS